MKRCRDEMEIAQQYLTIPHMFNMQQLQQQSRVCGSIDTSTSVRTSAGPELISQFYHQGLEIDALVRLQGERMRSELEIMMKRQRGEIIFLMGQMAKLSKDKDLEVQRANRRNIELEQKVRELAAESQFWFTAAKNNEALASNLKSTLEQVLLQSTESAAEYGGCDAEDAESCCYQRVDEREELRRRTACKVCGEKEVCALILPCRHLCLCNNCEPICDTCPVCNSSKFAGLQIFLSCHESL